MDQYNQEPENQEQKGQRQDYPPQEENQQYDPNRNGVGQNESEPFETQQIDEIRDEVPRYHMMQEPGLPWGLTPKKLLSRIGVALSILAVVVLGVQTIIEILVNSFKPELADTDWYGWALTAISLIVIGFPVYYLLMKRIPDSPRGEVVKLNFSRFFVIFFICTALMYITNIFSTILTLFISMIKGGELVNPAAEAIMNGNFIITLIYAAVVAPVFEELIFRKLLLGKLRRFGDAPAILMSGLAFGLFHLNLSQFFYAAVLGFVFAYVTIQTNTVIYSILLHMMINFISTVITPFVADANMAVYAVIIMWELVSITLGIVFLILNVKKIRLNKAAPVMKRSSYFFNAGTILYTTICLVMIALVTIRG